METYKLSIKDRQFGREVLRVVRVDAPSLVCERLYNPNAEPKPLNYDDNEFDTPFSIVHPFRHVAAEVVRDVFISARQLVRPEIEYDNGSVNEQQKTLFENILTQEYQRIKGQEPFRSGWK